jgi:photosystem II stability/assembly factor-like uncharacterized protein
MKQKNAFILVSLCILFMAVKTNAQFVRWEQTSGPSGGLLDRLFAFDDGLIFVRQGSYSADGKDRIYKSLDSGKSWSSQNMQDFEDPRDLGFSEIPGLLFSVDRNGLTLNSPNKGLTWIKTKGRLSTSYRVKLLSSHDTLYCLKDNSDLNISVDSGNTWNSITKGLPVKVVLDTGHGIFRYDTVIRVISTFITGRSAILVASDTGVSRSSNGGNKWLNATKGLNDSVILAFAADGDTIFAATKTGIYRSIDAGLSWSLSNAGYAIFIAENRKLVSATLIDNSFWNSTDAGLHWQKVQDSISVQPITGLGLIGSSVLVITHGQGVLKTEDLGKTWKESNYFLNDIGTTKLVMQGHSLFASAVECGIAKTTNGGRDWSQVWTSPENYTINCFLNGMNKIFASNDPDLYYSSDNGNSWHNDEMWSGPQHELIAAMGVIGSEILVGAERGWFVSKDSGKTWTLRSTNCGIGGEVSDAAFSQDSIWDVSSCEFWGSTDAGKTWNIVSNVGQSTIFPVGNNKQLHLGSGFAAFIMLDSHTRTLVDGLSSQGAGIMLGTPTRIFACTRVGVYESSNYGLSWQPDTDGIGAMKINDIAEDGDTLYISTQTGVFRGIYNNLLNINSNNFDPASFSCSLFPNPSNGITSITYKLSKRSIIQIEIFDVLGKKIRTVYRGDEDAGYYRNELDTSSLPIGNYFLHLVIDGVPSTKVLIILR